jgi:hypothetical protein
MFAPAQLLRNCREQRPSNKGNIDSSVTVEVRRVYYTDTVTYLFTKNRVYVTVTFKFPVQRKIRNSQTQNRHSGNGRKVGS